MKVELISYSNLGEQVCGIGARTCTSDKIPTKEDDTSKALRSALSSGHESILEHFTMTFAVSGVSRALTHQLVRHRLASYSQQSQRYVSLNEPTYVVPITVSGDPDREKVYKDTMDTIWNAYGRLMELGVPPEDARYLLPNGCTTNITITMNARELLHFFSLRCCNRAQWEIRMMADEMQRLCREVSPTIFALAGPPCIRGPCPEGKKSCGSPRKSV